MATTTGFTAPPDPTAGKQIGTESSLSNWAGDYVTNMLGKGQALSETPYQAYTGPLTAGASGLQQQAFGTAANLQTPASIAGASGIAGNIVNQYLGSEYDPTQFSNQFSAPALSGATQFSNQYTAPANYQDTQFNTGIFGTQQAQQYMNPYIQSALNPQLEEARRQAQISRLGDAARLSRAGAYGGGRQAMMESEINRNLMNKQADITGIGYNTAYDKAAGMFTSDQARNLEAQRGTEQSKQFGYGQQANSAQQRAQFGQAAQQAQEAARQFNQGQQMTGAQSQAQYGQAAKTASEQSKQFGADYGLRGLQGALSAAQAQGALGSAQNQADLANLGALSGLGSIQRGIEGEGIAADYGQFKEERDYPYKQVQYQQSLLQGMPLATQSYSYQQPSATSNAMGGAGSILSLYNSLFNQPAAKT